jgi:hypothetical protein
MEGLKALTNTLINEKKRLISELRRFSKRPMSNFVETDIVRKKALVDIWSTAND